MMTSKTIPSVLTGRLRTNFFSEMQRSILGLSAKANTKLFNGPLKLTKEYPGFDKRTCIAKNEL